ncbi:Electron transfer flavoprotein subunit beta, partial [Trichinella sp. T6]
LRVSWHVCVSHVNRFTDILRHALALGVDKAIHVEVDAKQYEHVEPLHVAKILQCIVKEEDINLVM